MTKLVAKVGALDIYTDEECPEDEIVLYNYGRMFLNPKHVVEADGERVTRRVVLKLNRTEVTCPQKNS